MRLLYCLPQIVLCDLSENYFDRLKYMTKVSYADIFL